MIRQQYVYQFTVEHKIPNCWKFILERRNVPELTLKLFSVHIFLSIEVTV